MIIGIYLVVYLFLMIVNAEAGFFVNLALWLFWPVTLPIALLCAAYCD